MIKPLAIKFSSSMPRMRPGERRPRASPRSNAVAIPAINPSIKCRLRSSTPRATAGASSIGRPRGSPPSDCVAAAAAPVFALPTTVYPMAAIPAAMNAYFSRLRTTPPRSASCVVADAIVVSDTGEMLSPNVAPPRIAPMSAGGFAPSMPPAG